MRALAMSGRFRPATALVVQPERTLMTAAEIRDSELFLVNLKRLLYWPKDKKLSHGR